MTSPIRRIQQGQRFNMGLFLHYNGVIMSVMASKIINLTIVYSTVFSGADQRKKSKLRVTGFCDGNSPVTGEFPAQNASNVENVSIWWRHHGWLYCFLYTLRPAGQSDRHFDDPTLILAQNGWYFADVLLTFLCIGSPINIQSSFLQCVIPADFICFLMLSRNGLFLCWYAAMEIYCSQNHTVINGELNRISHILVYHVTY